MPPKILAHLVVLCIETRCPKPNTVARLKSNYLASQDFWAGYATGQNPGGVDHICATQVMTCFRRFGVALVRDDGLLSAWRMLRPGRRHCQNRGGGAVEVQPDLLPASNCK